MLPAIRVDNGFQAVVANAAYHVTKDHPRYDELWQAVRDGDTDTFLDNFSVENNLKAAYSDTGVSVEDGVVYFNGEVCHGTLVDRILAFYEEGEDVAPMIKFLENLMSNPSKRAVDELYSFLEHECLPITEDGCFLAYKTVRSNYLDKYSGRFDNTPGQVLEMPRNKVDDDANRTCSNGFHVGALEYAGPNGWYNRSGDRVVICKVNPRDAVSVPADHQAQKLRVCKYEVIADYNEPLSNVRA